MLCQPVAGAKIPRTIHQIFLQGKLPPELQSHVEALKALNPTWRYKLYDGERAERLVDRYGGRIAKAYHRIDPRYGAARADFLRHLILYREGGVYLDIKSGVGRPLDEVIQPTDSYIVSQWERPHGFHADLDGIEGGEFVTYFLAASPGHPFSKAAIDRIVRNVREYGPLSSVGRNGVLRTTGPIAYTLALHPILDQHPHRFALDGELGLYPSIAYDHYAAFPQHYSTLDAPVVKLGPIGRGISRLCERLRQMKRDALERSGIA